MTASETPGGKEGQRSANGRGLVVCGHNGLDILSNATATRLNPTILKMMMMRRGRSLSASTLGWAIQQYSAFACLNEITLTRFLDFPQTWGILLAYVVGWACRYRCHVKATLNQVSKPMPRLFSVIMFSIVGFNDLSSHCLDIFDTLAHDILRNPKQTKAGAYPASPHTRFSPRAKRTTQPRPPSSPPDNDACQDQATSSQLPATHSFPSTPLQG